MEPEDLISQYDSVNKKIQRKIFERDSLIEKLEEKKNKLETLIEKKENTNKASIFLKSRALETRKESLDTISSMCTQAIQSVYGPDYELIFDYNENLLSKGSKSGFNITPKIISGLNDDKLITPIKDSRGGGLMEVLSVLLRFAILRFYDSNSTVILDETWASVSADEKMFKLITFINDYVKETGIQVLFITHRAEMFGKDADNIIAVKKIDGVANVSKISYDDVLNQIKYEEL